MAQNRGAHRVAVRGGCGQTVEQEVGGAGVGRLRCGACGPGDLIEPGSAGHTACCEGRVEGVAVGLACDARIERFELAGRHEQQRHGRTGTAGSEGDLSAQQAGLGVLQIVEGVHLGDVQQFERGVERSGEVLGAGRRQRSGPAAGGIGRQLDRPRQERRRRGDAAARLGAVGRADQFVRHRLVGLCRGAGQVPGTAVGVGPSVRGLGQSPVHLAALGQSRRAVDGGTYQRMPELDPCAHFEQARGQGGGGLAHGQAEEVGRAVKQETSPTGSAAARSRSCRVCGGAVPAHAG